MLFLLRCESYDIVYTTIALEIILLSTTCMLWWHGRQITRHSVHDVVPFFVDSSDWFLGVIEDVRGRLTEASIGHVPMPLSCRFGSVDVLGVHKAILV